MDTPPPKRAAGSLLERAAETFDLRLVAPRGVRPEAAPSPAFAAPIAAPAPRPTVPAAAIPPAPPAQAAGTNRAIVPLDLDRLREAGFIIPGAPATILSEEFRHVKRGLLLNALGGGNNEALPNGRLILVCSGHPNEGKTFTAVNLALSLANERDIEVLLIDADVAKPEVLSTLGLPGTYGLMDALVDPSLHVEDLIIQTDIPNLQVLPAGRAAAQDTEALASDHASALIQGLITRNPRRVVVFDSAPVLSASPAAVLAHHVGQMLMVVCADRTTEPELREAVTLLDGCRHIYLMLNSVTYTGAKRKYGSYYGLGD